MSVRLVERRKNSLPIERALFSVLWEEEGLSLCNNNRKYALFLCEIALLTLSDLIKLLVHANHRHSIKDTFSHEMRNWCTTRGSHRFFLVSIAHSFAFYANCSALSSSNLHPSIYSNCQVYHHLSNFKHED